MSAAKCNVCGRFRSWADVVSIDYGDEYGSDVVEECITCTAPANLKHERAA
ncbi:hypothetical protein ABIB35_001515 [Arthrobacter sp. UYP6]|uniref:hypothetical protein n=1 Tax=Arthrobacter sp. UYP6 TaxID=1756378 RepID=UPI0033915CF2